MRYPWLLLVVASSVVSCTRSGFGGPPLPDAAPDARRDGTSDTPAAPLDARDTAVDVAEAGRPISCTPLGEVGTSAVDVFEPGISVDGQRLFARGGANKQYVTHRVGTGGVWSAWGPTTAIPEWTQDPSFITIGNTEHLFAARDVAESADRRLWVCVGPFAEGSTPSCQQLVVTPVGSNAPFDADLDGPSMALVDGRLTMTFNHHAANHNWVMVGHPTTAGLIVAWQGERLQGGALDADDVVISDDAKWLVSADVSIDIYRRDAAGHYRLAHSESAPNVSGGGTELFVLSDGALEVFYPTTEKLSGVTRQRVSNMLCRP